MVESMSIEASNLYANNMNSSRRSSKGGWITLPQYQSIGEEKDEEKEEVEDEEEEDYAEGEVDETQSKRQPWIHKIHTHRGRAFLGFLELGMGGLYMFGSMFYFTECTSSLCAAIGGWSFTVASLILFLIDVLDLASFYVHPILHIDGLSVPELYGFIHRMEAGLYSPIISVISSFIFLVGSILFIPQSLEVLTHNPQLDGFETGTLIFVYGSLFVGLASLLRIVRKAYDGAKGTIQLDLLRLHPSAVLADLLEFFAMFLFCIGSIWFLPGWEAYTNYAAGSFVLGSILLMFSSLCILYSIDNPDKGRTIYFHFPSLERSYRLKEKVPCPKTIEMAKEYVRKRTTTL